MVCANNYVHYRILHRVRVRRSHCSSATVLAYDFRWRWRFHGADVREPRNNLSRVFPGAGSTNLLVGIWLVGVWRLLADIPFAFRAGTFVVEACLAGRRQPVWVWWLELWCICEQRRALLPFWAVGDGWTERCELVHFLGQDSYRLRRPQRVQRRTICCWCIDAYLWFGAVARLQQTTGGTGGWTTANAAGALLFERQFAVVRATTQQRLNAGVCRWRAVTSGIRATERVSRTVASTTGYRR